MPNASYNASGDDGRPAIVPATDGAFIAAGLAVQTRVGSAPASRLTQVFPHVPGAGSLYFGPGPIAIQWELTAQVYPGASPTRIQAETNQLAFENDLRKYIEQGGRYRLITERGRYYDHVEVVDFESLEEPAVVGVGEAGAGKLLIARARFLWMQPGQFATGVV